MGRPVAKKYFKNVNGQPIKVLAVFPDLGEQEGVIQEQVSSSTYIARNGIRTTRARLVNKEPGTLVTGEMTLSATDSDDETVRIAKLHEHLAHTYESGTKGWSFGDATESTLQIETVADGESVETPVVTPGVPPSSDTLKPDGKLLIGNNNPASGGITVSNNELEIFFRPGFVGIGTDIPRTGNNYTLNTQNTRDWNWTFSYYLVNNPAAKTLVDLYDIELSVASTYVNFTAFIELDSNNLYHFRNTDKSIDVIDNVTNDIRSLIQNIERLSFVTFGTAHPHNTAGYPIGTFTFTITATRKEGDFDPLVLTSVITVS